MNDTAQYVIRVTATTETGFINPRTDITVVWEGTDTDLLSRQYPPSEILGADPLWHNEIEDGFIRTNFVFQRQLPTGIWEEIDDPRRRLTPLTDLERAIDAENRRDFPSDYITVDCEQCSDHGCPECDPDDDYRPNCSQCDDYGCAACDPNWCSLCDNEGCATCDPANVCPSCGYYIDPRYDTPRSESGLCQTCHEEQSRPSCLWCRIGLNQQEASKGELCDSCQREVDRLETESNQPRCNICNDLLGESECRKGELCDSCTEEWKDDPYVFPPSPRYWIVIRIIGYIFRWLE